MELYKIITMQLSINYQLVLIHGTQHCEKLVGYL